MLLLGGLSWPSCAVPAASTPTILVLGDSLSAGYGLNAEDGWVCLLERKLRAEGLPHRVVNASVSGDTSAGGLARLPAALERYEPQIVLIELGANDGLRALPLPAMRENLQRMVALARDAGATPVLLEMRIPSNYGPAYTDDFAAIFGQIAEAEDVPLVPFFLREIALDVQWFQADGMHPNAAAQPLMLDAVWPTLQPLLLSAGQAAR